MFLEFLNALPHSMHVTAMMFCKIPSRILCIHMMFIEFLWVCTKQFALNSNQIIYIFFSFNFQAANSPVDLFHFNSSELQTPLRGPKGQGSEPTTVMHGKSWNMLNYMTNIGGWGQGSPVTNIKTYLNTCRGKKAHIFL